MEKQMGKVNIRCRMAIIMMENGRIINNTVKVNAVLRTTSLLARIKKGKKKVGGKKSIN